jgi:hypothetical protein
MDTPLVERVAALAAEAESEATALAQRKAEMLTEREAEVAAVRERYAVKLAEIDSELKVIAKLRRALTPEAERKRRERKDTSDQRRKQSWKPSAETMTTILRAMESGAETVPTITAHEGVSVSSSSVKIGLDAMRDEGKIRLAGTTGGKGAAKKYKLTPQGREALSESSNGRVIVESQA